MKSELITSRDNRRLIEARRVRDGKAADKIFIEGRRLVEEALRSRVSVESAFVAGDLRHNELLAGVRGAVYEISADLFRSIADTDNPQGVAIIAQRPPTGPNMIEQSSAHPLVVFLNEINNPSNLGAVIRTAEAAGVRGVIVSNKSADVFSPKALRSAMGSSFRLPIWDGALFKNVVSWARRNTLTPTASDVSSSKPYTSIDWKTPRLLIFGSEAHGLTTEQRSAATEAINIPMAEDVESLNLAVAAGIIFFEAKRQNEQ